MNIRQSLKLYILNLSLVTYLKWAKIFDRTGQFYVATSRNGYIFNNIGELWILGYS